MILSSVLVIISGCSSIEPVFSKLKDNSVVRAVSNPVMTYNSTRSEGKEDWAKVTLDFSGTGNAFIFAYKKNESGIKKMAASNPGNIYSDALLFPDEVNYIVLQYRYKSKIGSLIFNDVNGLKNKSYTIIARGIKDKFAGILIDNETNKKADYRITGSVL